MKKIKTETKLYAGTLIILLAAILTYSAYGTLTITDTGMTATESLLFTGTYLYNETNFVIPVNEPSSPVLGSFYFNTTDNKAYVYSGVVWIALN